MPDPQATPENPEGELPACPTTLEFRVNDPRGIHGPFTDHEEAIRVQRECALTVDRQTMRAPVIEFREVTPWRDEEYNDG